MLAGAALGLYEGRALRGASRNIGVRELTLRPPPSPAWLGGSDTEMTPILARPMDEAAERLEALRWQKRELETRLASLEQEMAQLDPNAVRDAYELAW
jgi:hypothetical protein